MKPKQTLAGLLCVICVSALAYTQEVKMKGMITTRTGDEMTIRTADGDQVVVLSDDTKAQVPSGVFRHKETSMAELIPGLAVEVTGLRNGDKLVAKTIRYTKDDLKTANAIQAGLVITQQNVTANREAITTNKENIATNQQNIATNQQNIATNKEQISANQAAVEQRFADLSDYDVKGSTVVYFQIGKATLTPKNKAALLDLARKAATLQGYMIEVKGFCDSTGNASQNQALSRDRAEAVVGFLHQEGNIPVRHVLAPGAMGVVDPAASNETATGRAENRRVEVKVLVNRGLAASTVQ